MGRWEVGKIKYALQSVNLGILKEDVSGLFPADI